MSVAMIGTLGVALLLALIFLRVPIAVALAASGLVGYAAIDGWSPALKMFGLVPYQLASAYSLSVIPLFILMGAVAARGKMATELFQACNAARQQLNPLMSKIRHVPNLPALTIYLFELNANILSTQIH